MPSYALNNITAPDQYTAASTLANLDVLDHVNIDASGQAIYWSLQQTNALTTDISGTWQPEVFMSPGSRSLYRANMVGIKIRAAIPAASLPAGSVPAQVTIEAVAP